MKKVKYIIPIVVIMLAIGYTYFANNFNILNLRNDSGFDTSYSDGGHSSGGYSGGGYSGGGYSSGHSSSHNYGSSSSGGESIDLISAIIIILMIVLTFASIFNTYLKFGQNDTVSFSKALTEEDIRKIIPDFKLQKFLDDRLKDFIDIQIAWRDFDYDVLREKLTDSLYNQYVMQLDTLKEKNQKNVMDDFKPVNIIVTDVKEVNEKYIVDVSLEISFKDYIEEKGEVVRGDKDATIVQKYKLTFIRAKEEQFKYCPNCGAELTDSASQTCKYCRTTISRVSTKWVLSEKKSIQQKVYYK